MAEPAHGPRSNLRSLTLLGGFAAFVAALPLLTISLPAFLLAVAVIVGAANFAFLRFFSVRAFTSAATLIAFNLLVADVTAIIMLAVVSPQNDATDYFLSAIPVLAIGYAALQAFFVREQW